MLILRIVLLAGAAALAGAIFWAMGADPRGLGPILEGMAGTEKRRLGAAGTRLLLGIGLLWWRRRFVA